MQANSTPSEYFAYIIKKLRFIGRLLGADVLNPHYKPNNIILYLMYFLITLYFILVLYTARTQYNSDSKKVLEAFCFGGNIAKSYAKLSMAYFFSMYMRSATSNLEKVFIKYEKIDRYKEILLRSFRKIKMTVLLNVFVYSFGMIIVCIFPLFYYFLRNEKMFAMNLLIPGISPDTVKGYFMLYIIQITALLLGLIGNIAADTFFISLTLGTTILSDILQQKIVDFNNDLSISYHRIYGLKDIVEWLNLYYIYNNKIKKIFFWVVTVDIFSGAFGAVMGVFLVVVGDWPPAYLLTITNMMSIYIFCIIGTMCDNAADKVIDLIYEIHWYLLKPSNQKVVLLLLLKSQRKELLTVAHVAPLAVNTALQITKTVYSYGMMLMNFVE